MTTLRTAAQQALEALELAQTDVYWELNSPTRKFLRKAEKNLRAALAEPVQEPVASLMTNVQSGDVEVVWNDDGFDREMWHETPLYTAPPQRLPLTEEEIAELARQEQFLLVCDGLDELTDITRAIERAHGIGGKDD